MPYGPGHPGIVRPSPISASLPQNAPTEQEVLDHMMSGHMQRYTASLTTQPRNLSIFPPRQGRPQEGRP